jgi:protein SEY1
LLTGKAVLRNPFLFLLLIMLAGGFYVAYTLNLLGPMIQMANAATNQGIEIGKQKLREFLENSETGRQAVGMPARNGDGISLDTLDNRGKKSAQREQQDDDS